MMPILDVTVRGAIETREKLEQVARDLHGDAMIDGMRDAALIVEADAKRNAPVDTGRLRSSITSQVTVVSKRDVQGVVGSNVRYAPYMELGTGTFVGRRRYFPPPSQLQRWAGRHGVSAYAVALAIYRRGGLEPRRYLQRAFERNQHRIVRILNTAVSSIVKR